MSDFDDLLSSSRQPKSAPFLDNPFQDVFEGVTGRREPDPWSTGGWGEPEPEVHHSISQSSLSPPSSPGAAGTYHSAGVPAVTEEILSTESLQSPQTPGFWSHQERPQDEPPQQSGLNGAYSEPRLFESHEDRQKGFDPLDATATSPSGQAPDTTPTANHREEEPSRDAPLVQPEVSAPDGVIPVVVETPAAEAAQPISPRASLSEARGQGPLSAVIDQASNLGNRVTPSIPPSPLTPHPTTPSMSSSLSTHSNNSSSNRDFGSSSQTLADSSSSIDYNRITSPLDTPASQARRVPLEQSFSNLALGGEVPGWGAPIPAAYQPSGTNGEQHAWGGSIEGYQKREEAVSNDNLSPSGSVATVKEDDDDERPLGVQANANGHTESQAPPPTFVITVGDPQKVGDPLKAHIVYTVHTKTTAPNFVKPSFSVLRRYSDFLWLYEALSANNPGIIVPPVPDKNPLSVSRFESAFVEGRRFALEKCVTKMANHPVLSKDADLKFFLESDSFALDIKHRRQENSQGTGILASFGSLAAPRFYEVDEWFDNKRAYLDALESQLKGLVKAIDLVSKQRADFAVSVSEFADTVAALSVSDLSKQLTSSLVVLADVERLYKDLQDTQVKDDMVTVMGTADEYSRLISSVRLAFNSRIKLYFASQTADSDFRRVKAAHEKQRRQGRSTGSMAEIAEAERRAVEAKREFDTVTKLIKVELARFEAERVEDFKTALEQFLTGMIKKQQTLIQAWEKYQDILLKRAASNPTRTSDGGSSNEAEVDAEDI
ncbi:Vacuolar protein sorting-associated protein 5 [Tulasnella sp. JGI-2019a]|nr:Vacuolar protein sorting-associated protein 5 [Tulasnella sp. JGI-2019a]KAG8993291.1 Vacuolar protein sorting-associated protein 5 [Tulasnella sp. JGI-2019a]